MTPWSLQKRTGVDWHQMKVERNGTVYPLKNGLNDLPGGALHPGDYVLLPSSCKDDDKCEVDAVNTMNQLSSSGPPTASKQGANAK